VSLLTSTTFVKAKVVLVACCMHAQFLVTDRVKSMVMNFFIIVGEWCVQLFFYGQVPTWHFREKNSCTHHEQVSIGMVGK